MVHIIRNILILIILAFISTGIGQEPVETGDLTIIVKGFENSEGMAMIALNNSQEDYEEKGAAFRGNEVEITDEKAILTIEGIPFGEYAIKVFHDEDDDGELDSNFLGMPTEDYGFSNDARGTMGPASWEDAKFLFKSQIDTVVITVE